MGSSEVRYNGKGNNRRDGPNNRGRHDNGTTGRQQWQGGHGNREEGGVGWPVAQNSEDHKADEDKANDQDHEDHDHRDNQDHKTTITGRTGMTTTTNGTTVGNEPGRQPGAEGGHHHCKGC